VRGALQIDPAMPLEGCAVLALIEPLRAAGWRGVALVDPASVPCRTGKAPDKALKADLRKAGVRTRSP
jgi:hypothetical protein